MDSSKTFFKYDSSQAGKEITKHKLFLKLLETIQDSCSFPPQSSDP